MSLLEKTKLIFPTEQISLDEKTGIVSITDFLFIEPCLSGSIPKWGERFNLNYSSYSGSINIVLVKFQEISLVLIEAAKFLAGYRANQILEKIKEEEWDLEWNKELEAEEIDRLDEWSNNLGE